MNDKNQMDAAGIKVSLEYAKNIIATLREPFLVLDKNLRVISANRVFYTTFAVTEKDTLGQLLPDLGNGQWNIPKLLHLLKEIIPEKKVVTDYEVEHKFERINQRVMVLNACQLRVSKQIAAIIVEGVIKREEAAGEELILLAIEDITERKRLEVELQASEERYRRAFETSRDGLLLVHKTEGGILNSNASVQELLGYSSEEFLKKKLWEIGVTKDSKDFQEMVSRLEKDGVIYYEDMPVKTKKELDIKAEVFLVNKAKVLQCNIRDIAIRKEAEEALKESEMRFKTIFNESTDGMLLMAGESRRLFMCNQKICQMLGYSEEEMTRLRVEDIHPENDRPFIIELFERLSKGELKFVTSLPLKRKDNSILYADLNTSLLTLSGKKYLLGSFRDVTNRKKIEDELKEKMQDLERFSKFAVDRELRMQELEDRMQEMEKELKDKS